MIVALRLRFKSGCGRIFACAAIVGSRGWESVRVGVSVEIAAAGEGITLRREINLSLLRLFTLRLRDQKIDFFYHS